MSRVKYGICKACGFPPDYGGQVFHGHGTFGAKCQSPAKDKVIPVCWSAFRVRKAEVATHFRDKGFRDNMTDLDFAKWLWQCSGGVTHLCHLFTWCMKL